MSFPLSDEQLAFVEMAQSFARDKLAPHAANWDKDHVFPVEVLKEAASLGLAAMYCRSDIGGSELSRFDAALVFEALSEGCISTSAYLSIHNMVTKILDLYGSEALRTKYGEQLSSMSLLASYCLTEPNSGSDAASLKTTARLEGNEYVINGSKAFISGAGVSDLYLCMVRTGEDGYKGISAILIEKGTPGLSFGENEKKLGWHSQPTRMVFLEDCRVPKENIVGSLGDGFKIALSALNGGRINIAACSLGGAKACLKAVKEHMGEREQFNKTLSRFQALRFRYADMLTNFKAAQLMTYHAAQTFDQGDEEVPLNCAMAKRFTTDACFEIANQSMQLFGGYGYLEDYPIERIFRDLRVHQILEGTNEIMREIIAKEAFK
jgi:alkylation response protein AidB-like acyl-CoA dehydrogenase